MSTNKQGAVNGAAQGATAGATFGPWGAAIGAVVGGVMGAQGGEGPSIATSGVDLGPVTFDISGAPKFSRRRGAQSSSWFKYTAAGLSIATGYALSRMVTK